MAAPSDAPTTGRHSYGREDRAAVRAVCRLVLVRDGTGGTKDAIRGVAGYGVSSDMRSTMCVSRPEGSFVVDISAAEIDGRRGVERELFGSLPTLRQGRFSQSLERGLAVLASFRADRDLRGVSEIAAST